MTSSRRRRHAPAGALALLLACQIGAVSAAGAGRLEEDAFFLLGRWSSDCAAGEVRIFLDRGALRQRGLLRVAPAGGGDPITPVTLLAATRDGPGLVLQASTEEGGFASSARYTARVADEERVTLTSMTLCREARCRSVTLDVPWTRCPES